MTLHWCPILYKLRADRAYENYKRITSYFLKRFYRNQCSALSFISTTLLFALSIFPKIPGEDFTLIAKIFLENYCLSNTE